MKKVVSLMLLSFLLSLFISLQMLNAQVSVTATQGTNRSYTSLGSAFSAINSGTHKGVITISITGNTNEGSAPTSLRQSGYNGTSSYTNISIQPSGEAARTISGSVSGGATIKLNGADNVTIDGLNTGGNSLTIVNTSSSATTGTSAICFIYGATNNTVTNCTVQGSFSGDVNRETGSTTKGGVIYFADDTSTPNGNDNNTISNCNIGPAGTNLPTVGIFGYGSTTTLTKENSGNIISNNNIYDFFSPGAPSAGIYSSDGCNSWTITGNRFYQTAARTFTASETSLHRVIDIQPRTATSGAAGTTITYNIIGYASSSQTGTYSLSGGMGKFIGIYYYPVTSWPVADISYNTIASVSLTGVQSSDDSGTPPFAGIVINNNLSYVNNSPANTNNNTIGSMSETGSLYFSTNISSADSPVDVCGILNLCNSTADYQANNNCIGGITVENIAPAPTTNIFTIYGIKQYSGSTNFIATSNIIGGTVANSIQNNSTSIYAQVIGISHRTSNCNISSNTVRNLTCAGGTQTNNVASVIGIFINPRGNAATNNSVSGNLIHSLSNTSTTGYTNVVGIYCYTSSGSGAFSSLIEKNLIHSFSMASTNSSPSTGALISGIRIENSAVNASATIANNMISLGWDPSGASITTGIKIYGINESAGTNNFYFNSVLIGGTEVTGSNITCALYSSNSAIRRYQNNIFYNARSNASGATGQHYAVALKAPNLDNLIADKNNYYTSGTGGVFGSYSSTDVLNDVSDLAAWKTVTGKDANSKSLNTDFTSSTDLHLTGSSLGNHDFDGTPISGITTDYDGQVRDITIPYIGADEVISSPLPVELTEFTASLSSSAVSLSWQTATEINNYGFEVERVRGCEGVRVSEWEKIGFIRGHGNSNSPKSYSFVDGSPAGSSLQYRLKQIDNDGTFKYSDIVKVNLILPDKTELLQNYPNPFNPVTAIKFTLNNESSVKIMIYDLIGREIKELINEKKPAGLHIVYWNGTDGFNQKTASGIYVYRLIVDGMIIDSRKMNLLK